MPAVTGAALRGWALLLSTLPVHRLTAPFVESSLAALAQQLYSEATDVRAAAGEAIALLYDAAGLADLESDSGRYLAPSSGQPAKRVNLCILVRINVTHLQKQPGVEVPVSRFWRLTVNWLSCLTNDCHSLEACNCQNQVIEAVAT